MPQEALHIVRVFDDDRRTFHALRMGGFVLGARTTASAEGTEIVSSHPR